MSSFDSIVSRKPRENAGALAANRFEYQLDWGLRKLLMLEESGESYTIIFDYHDDILVLDSDDSPKGIDFYQVKTNTAAAGWSCSLLTQVSKKKKKVRPQQVELFDKDGDTIAPDDNDDVEEDEKYSKLAKLLIHSLDFPNDAREFFFVTNANFGGTLIKGSKLNKAKELDFADLVAKAREEIRNRVKKELGDKIDETVFDHLHFIKNQMNVDDHSKTVVGYITDFLENHYPKAKAIAKPVYVTLIEEIRKRNNYETEPNSVNDLLANKAFTKKQFHQFLKGIETIESLESKKGRIENYLMKFLPDNAAAQRRRILAKVETIREETLVYDNNEFLRLCGTIDTLIENISEEEGTEWDWTLNILAQLKQDGSFTTTHDEDFLTCLILYELCK